MIARAACAALAIAAGALASSPASAQPLPQPPPWAAAPAPPAYAPWPMIYRDGAWRPFGGFVDVEPPPPPKGSDPLFPAGLALGIGGLITSAFGVGWLASAGSSLQVCGLSGCLARPDLRTQNYAAALVAGGAASAIFGGAVAYFGAMGPPSARRSNARMITGLAFTAVGLGVAVSGLTSLAGPYDGRTSVPGAVLPRNYTPPSGYTGDATILFALASVGCLAVGLPLWITGARSPAPARRWSPYETASRIDLLPLAGGAAIRWTR